MPRSNKKQIISYYSNIGVVDTYEKRRFKGMGGKFVGEKEIISNISLLRKYFFTQSHVRILDIGAGTGRLSSALTRAGYEVFCLDSSPQMVARLKGLFPPKNVVLQSAFEKIELPYRFDAMTALRFFDHFDLKNQKKLLSNFKSSLKKGGFIVFPVLNKTSIEFLLSKFLYFGKVNYYYRDSEYTKMLKSLDLNIIDMGSHFFIPRGAFLYSQSIPFLTQILIKIDILLSKLMPRCSALLVYLLKK